MQVFLEPEGRNTPELYVQGFSTGLPERLQLALLHTLPGEQSPDSTSAVQGMPIRLPGSTVQIVFNGVPHFNISP